MGKYRNYTDEDVVRYTKEVHSLRQLLGKLNLKEAGGNYDNIRRLLQKLGADTSHWMGPGWNKGKQLKDWTAYARASAVKPHLIKKRGHRCEECHITEWRGLPVVLEIHHIDGDRTNNAVDNLFLICPNCHSMTDNWRGRGNKCTNTKQLSAKPPRKTESTRKKIVNKLCTCCSKPISKLAHRCKSCSKYLQNTKIEWPAHSVLTKMVLDKGYCQTGNELGVSDNAVRKRIKRNTDVEKLLE